MTADSLPAPAVLPAPAGVPAPAVFPVPAVGKPKATRLPAITDHTLRNGLRVLVARRKAIPRFECRLVVPIAREGVASDAARLRVLTETVLSGTADRTSRTIAEDLQAMGAGLGSYADAEQLLIGGSTLASSRSEFLALFGEVLLGATFRPDEVAVERERLVSEIAVQRSQPGTIANDALVRRLYGRHPYGWGTPDPDVVAKTQPAVLRRLHAERVLPAGSLLVLVGDLDPDAAIADVEAAFGRWRGAKRRSADLTPPAPIQPGPASLLDRPGAPQTTIRMGGPALPRSDPRYPALMLAVTIFGGSFTSRLNDNIREQKGYTYGAHARVEQRRVAAQVTVAADVRREVTAASIAEIHYEMGRMVSLPVEQAELHAARRYLQGTLAMGIQTQAGLTSYLATLVSAGQPVSYLRDYPAALEAVGVDDVLEVSREFLAPTGFTTVLVGDADSVGAAVRPLLPLEG